MKNSLFKKFLSFSIGGYLALIIGFLTTPITTRMLSPEQYGVASIFALIVNVSLIIISLGHDQGFVRYFYSEEENNRGSLLRNSLKIPLVLFLVFGLITLIFREEVSKFIFNKSEFTLIIVLIVTTFFTLINRFAFLVTRMQQKGKLFSFFQVLNPSITFILILGFYKIYGDSYKTLVYTSMIGIMVVTLLSIFLERDFWKRKGNADGVSQMDLIKYSLPLSITMALQWIFTSFDKVAIKEFANMNELGLYSAAFKIVALLNIVQSSFTTFWTPVAFERYEKDNNDREFFKNMFELVSFVMIIIAISILMGKDLVILLLGQKYKEASLIVPTLVFMPLMYTISETTVLGINFKKKSKYHIYITVTVALVNVIGNMILVPKFGARGAAIATGFAYIVFFTLRTYFSKKMIDFGFGLKKFYSLVIQLFIFSVYLSFYSNLWFTLTIGFTLIIETFILYREIVTKNIKSLLIKRGGK